MTLLWRARQNGSAHRFQIWKSDVFTVAEKPALWVVRSSLHEGHRQSQHVFKVTQALFAHSQHQVVNRRGGRGAVALTSYHVQATDIRPINPANNRAGEGPGAGVRNLFVSGDHINFWKISKGHKIKHVIYFLMITFVEQHMM